MKKITQQFLARFISRAYQTAAKQGYYPPETNINQHLMLIITEMAEVIDADRHSRHGDTEDYLKNHWADEDFVYYEEAINDTVESEFADIAIRLMSLLGWLESKEGKIEIYDDIVIGKQLELYKIELPRMSTNLPTAFYHIISKLTLFPYSTSPTWLNIVQLQETLLQVFALAKLYDIDIITHIQLKTRYNERRPYLHGCKY